MIEVKKGFEDRLFKQEFMKHKPNEYTTLLYIHKYDRQKLKSLLNEQMEKDGLDYTFLLKRI